VRLQRALFSKSAIGVISVNRWQNPKAQFDNYNNLINAAETAQAVDLNLLKGDHISWASQFMVNTNGIFPDFDAQHLGWESNFAYNSETYGFFTGGKFLGRHVDLSQIGFEPETDRWGGYMEADYKPFINRWGIRQLFFNLNYDEKNGTHGELQDSGADAQVTAQFKNFWSAEARYSYDRVRFNNFEFCDSTASCDARVDRGNPPVPGRLFTTRIYLTPIYVLQLSSNTNRAYSFVARYTAGKQVQYDWSFYGYRKQLDLTLNARVGDHLVWNLTGTQVREYLWNNSHYQNRNFLISRWLYQFTPKFRARILAQYQNDHQSSNLSINSLIAYDFTARSAFYVGYNHQKQSPLDPADLGNVVFVKVSYLFSF
jgi:hypothetical protein